MVGNLVDVRNLEPYMSATYLVMYSCPKKYFVLRCPEGFRGLNAQTGPDRYPIEDPKRHIEWLASKMSFTCVDLKDN
jgi:hypothetical protein